MSDFIDLRIEPGLWFLGDWSLRWAVLIAALGAWFALRPPRRAAARLAACQLVLVAGLGLPLVPHWWGNALLPVRNVTTTADDVASEPPIAELPEPVFHPPVAKSAKATATPLSQPLTSAEPMHSDIPAAEPSSNTAAQTAEALGPGRIVLLIAAAVWLIGVCVQLTRLVAATISLSRLRRGAVGPQLRSQELFDRCRDEIGLRRRVCLRIHSALTAPVFVGGWNSMVLVPSDWQKLPVEAQRAVLWHELAHVARRDDWAKLAEEAIRAVFFFHPLVSWLLNRVDGYREQVCDAAAVRRGVGGRMLAQILVDFSRRNSASLQRDLAMPPALPFFRRRTVRNRIHELLADQTVARWSAPLVRYQFIGLTVIAASTGIALGGLGPQAIDSAPEPAPVASDAESQPPASPAPNTASDKAAATTDAASVSPTLERILAHWKARQERTKSLYFAWDSRIIVGQDADDRIKGKMPATPAADRSHLLQLRFWAEAPDRLRLDRVPSTATNTMLTAFDVKTQSVWDGTTLTRFEDPGNAAGSPVCTIWARRGEKPPSAMTAHAWSLSALTWHAWQPGGWTLNALALTFHPQDAFVAGKGLLQFRVLNENALIDGLRCVELQHAADSGNWVENCWVDPARDDIVVEYRVLLGPDEKFRANNSRSISIQYQLDPVHGWVPARWTIKQPRDFSVSTVTKFTINEKFRPKTFTSKPAPGTVVFDQRTDEEYRVLENGAKYDVVKFDSLMSLRTQEVLESRTDFRIEPQSLKDAIDFIAARYGIPILLNQQDFAAAGIDLTSEVQFKREGIAVAELLKILLGQMSAPAGFRIEDEVLKISPKFARQAPIEAKSAPAPVKFDSPAARNIQKVLEQPVDFNIQPESLKDVFDFIKGRYQIPITLDPSIDGTIEIKGAFPGIRFKSLLSILLEQYPKPLGFKIEDNALKIFPKAVIPQPPAAKGASHSETSAMNLAIQQALETKTDAFIGPASLQDVLHRISKRHKINIVLDTKALDEASIDSTTKLKLKFGESDSHGITVRRGLERLLAQFNPPLRCEIRDGVLLITTSSPAATPRPARPVQPLKK